jgi:competence protein ComEA
MAVAMSTRPEQSSDPAHPWLLRRSDQLAVASLVLFSLIAMAGYWWTHGGGRGGLIEIDRETPKTAQYLVDINTADWPEFSQLPGIGEGLGRRIVESREREGQYVDHNDLQRVRGIGPKTLERLRPYLRPMPEAANVAGN